MIIASNYRPWTDKTFFILINMQLIANIVIISLWIINAILNAGKKHARGFLIFEIIKKMIIIIEIATSSILAISMLFAIA